MERTLVDLIEEFRSLELRRRQGGLSLGEAERYYSLFARLDEVLASGERHRKADQRQFLRVPADLMLTLRSPDGPFVVACSDFGGGGCFVHGAPHVRPGDTLWLDGAELHGEKLPLHGRAVVAWVESIPGTIEGQGVRFVLECDEFRDQIDRLFYRVLDELLHEGMPEQTERKPPRSRATAEVDAPVVEAV